MAKQAKITEMFCVAGGSTSKASLKRMNKRDSDRKLAFVKGSVLVWVTDKYSEREARALSAECARFRRGRNASAASAYTTPQREWVPPAAGDSVFLKTKRMWSKSSR